MSPPVSFFLNWEGGCILNLLYVLFVCIHIYLFGRHSFGISTSYETRFYVPFPFYLSSKCGGLTASFVFGRVYSGDPLSRPVCCVGLSGLGVRRGGGVEFLIPPPLHLEITQLPFRFFFP